MAWWRERFRGFGRRSRAVVLAVAIAGLVLSACGRGAVADAAGDRAGVARSDAADASSAPGAAGSAGSDDGAPPGSPPPAGGDGDGADGPGAGGSVVPSPVDPGTPDGRTSPSRPATDGSGSPVSTPPVSGVTVRDLPGRGPSTTAWPRTTAPGSVDTTITVAPQPGAAPTVTTLRASAPRVSAGSAITLEATTRTPAGVASADGAVTFYDGSAVVGQATIFFGHYSLTIDLPAVGEHAYRAAFGGASAFLPSSSSTVTATVDAVLWPDPPPPGDPNFHPQTVPPYTGTGETIGLLGDSITNYDLPRFVAAANAAGFATAGTGMNGYRLSTSKPWIDLFASTAPRVMIVNLGTNDAGSEALGDPNYTVGLYRQRMDLVASAFPRSCFVVTTLTSHRTVANSNPASDGYQPQVFDAIAASYNAYLRSSFAHVADWDAVVAAHPEYLGDGVHPRTAEAQQALAAVQVAAAQACT